VSTTSGDLAIAVQRLVDLMPRPDSQAYDPPMASETAMMASAFLLITEGRLQEAARLVAPLHYSVVRFTDVPTGRQFVVLQELRNPDGSWPHAWGLYVYSPGSTSRLIVEVAHPLDDIDTPPVGVETFRLANARALLVAGASRFANAGDVADVAHDGYSVFQAVHGAALVPGAVVFEPHGFEQDRHESYGDVVVSTGAFPPDALAAEVAAALRKAGFSVCLYDGTNCSELGGTTNVQGASTRAASDTFLHLEMSIGVRSDQARRELVARIVARLAG